VSRAGNAAPIRPNMESDEIQEEKWCAEQRMHVEAYLKKQGVAHGRIGEWPAWLVAP